eukprot:scaffold3484_cov69-Phaeocystis_antarctica.AAC.7
MATSAGACAGDELALATLLHALVPPSVVQAEARILAGHASEEAVRRLLEFHQGVVGPVATVFAFALPSEAALAAVARWSPGGVVELGAGEGLWAWLLRRRGVAVHAFDAVTSCPYDGSWGSTVQTGGPMEAACHPGCSLLLCWPPLELECAVGGSDGGGSGGGSSDGGVGSCGCGGSSGGGSSATGGGGERLLSEDPCNLMGLTALRAYAGDVLLYVGEWQGASGALSELSWRTAAGQAAGRRFQMEVECSWELEELIPLPRWPGFADCLRVFRRRGASTAVEETAAAPACPEPPPPPPPPPPPQAIGENHNSDGSSNQSGGGGVAPSQLGRRLQAMQRLGLCQPQAVAAAVWVARLMGEC